ncbi:variable surface protein Vir18, putative [Plasmodium vivax]|uniref:Variable surface protein Vir18, putative n=1 Tax=Plasmodium vivax (strain Salvador I) TaxID=126793 RepID=A5KCZ7_PLAVS|nr:variable surface protein Vir18, putative [Plasmodium vivax]EDL42771.1 variable surface protein Vir18, putative [Plasmodium vivax]|eukprot:XP_001612564.1 variable surface protein Vir18 [Plasmodium vivax Sal-1]
MGWPFGRYNIISNLYNRYNDAPCMNTYATIKSDIIQKIEDFEKATHDNFYEQWDQLNKHIIQKDKELSACYKKRYVNSKLNDDETIKNFKKKCNAKRECNNGKSPAKKTPIIKPTTQRNCKGSMGCKSETTERVDFKSQSKFVPGPTDPKSLEIKNPKDQDQNQADVQKAGQESVVPQPQTITMPSGSSDGTHDKASQKIVIHHSTTPGTVETQEQQLNASVSSGIRGLDSSLSDPSSECVSGKTSDSTCTSMGKNLGTIYIQTNEHSGKTLDANNPETQDSAGNVLAEQTSDDKYITSKIAHNLSFPEGTPGFVQLADEDSPPTITDRGSTGAVASDPESTGTEKVVSESLSSAPSDARNNGITDVDMSNDFKAADSEIKSVKVSHVLTHGSEGLCTEGTCNEAQNTEITSNNNNDILGTLSRVFNVIEENKDNMIKASAPMGIVLLLGLLFKFTPLWRVLTKKNRKNEAVINEELNSVLQEPSIMDDERSIPFSYGAFEYSTFDQNSY